MKKTLFLIITALLMIPFVSSCNQQPQSGSKKITEKSENRRQPRKKNNFNRIPVEISYLEKGTINKQLLFSSALETEKTTTIFPKVSGEVVAILHDEGEKVKKGDVLLKIDDREYDIARQQAEINYKQLMSEMERLKKLFQNQFISQEEYDKAVYAAEQARLDMQLKNLNYINTRIIAPFDGVIAQRYINLGDRIQTTSQLFTVINLNEKIVKIYVPQNEIGKITKGIPAEIETEIIPDLTFRGKVKRIAPMVDQESGTFKVTVSVNDPLNKIMPGSFVNVSLLVETHNDALLVPKTALIYENELSYIYIVKKDSVQKIRIERGFEDAGKIEILNDLKEGTPVVVVGQNGLKNGAKIKITSQKEYNWQKKQKTFNIDLRRSDTAASEKKERKSKMSKNKNNSPEADLN